jgi:DNA invertase Pin-like site-specific DNA recombinase
MSSKMTEDCLNRQAIIYIRQSSPTQVTENLESQRRQYALVEKAKEYGFSRIEVIDDDLGRSGSGVVDRPGFTRMLALVCKGDVGAIFCIEASRLARNGRDWHHLIDLCGLVKTLIIDHDGIYNPLITNDRLLLGLKGTMSEFELNILKQRSITALKQKAKRGELKFRLPVGFCWTRQNKIELEPDQRVQKVIKVVFKKFAEFGSARQVLLWFHDEKVLFPRIILDEFGQKVIWKLPIYRNILSTIQNPVYAGTYAFGKTEARTKILEGRAHKTHGHRKPQEKWEVLIQDHHVGYISWGKFEQNQILLRENAHMYRENTPKSGRGGKALLSGLIRCGRCSRMMHVSYSGSRGNVARYSCRGANINHGRGQCISFGNLRVDKAISVEILKAVERDALEAAVKAEEQIVQQKEERCKLLLMELEEARYEEKLAAKRYESVDPEKRLVAAELESRWDETLFRIKEIETRLEKMENSQQKIVVPSTEMLADIGDNLSVIWSAASSDMSLKQRITRLLICEVIGNVNEEKSEINLTIHWKGGRHSQLRIPKNKNGHHSRRSSPDAVEIIKQMAIHYSDKMIATTLNRLGLKTGTGNSWNKSRVRSTRCYHGLLLSSALPIEKGKEKTLNLEETARQLKIHESTVRRLIQRKDIKATQIVSCAPWQIKKSELEKASVQKIVQMLHARKKLPPLSTIDDKNPVLFSLS